MHERRRRMLVALGMASVTPLAGCLNQSGDGECSHELSEDASNASTQSRSPPTEQVAKLLAEDGGNGDQFGSSIAVSNDGSTAVIGAILHEDENEAPGGAAYVFGQSSEGWEQQAKLAADDVSNTAHFGDSVALSDDGSIAVIGAYNDDTANGEDSGSAYVFSEAGGSWQQQAKLLPDDGGVHDSFGSSIAISSDGCTVVTGAPSHDDPNGIHAGAAYVFGEAGGEWNQRSKLVAEDGDDRDLFGGVVAMADDGRTVVIGANRDEGPSGVWGGAAYVFAESSGSWNQRARLLAQDGDDEDVFGSSASVSGDGGTAIIGANDEDPNGKRSGSAYVFRESGGSWQQEAKLFAEDGDDDDFFSKVVSIAGDGSTAVIGAPRERTRTEETAARPTFFGSPMGAGNKRPNSSQEMAPTRIGLAIQLR